MEIQVRNISKSFKGIEYINDVSFTCFANEIIGILAPRGNGKTLLLNLIRGKTAPDSGQATFLIEDKIIPQKALRHHLGFLSAENSLYPMMTVYDYLYYVARFYKLPNYLRKDRVQNLIKNCGLSRHKHKYISELSRGQSQRVGIAQALVHNPEFLLLDDPVKDLDPIQSEQLYELIKEQSKERTVLISSSRMQDIEAMCNTILVLSNGNVLTKGAVSALQQEVENSSTLKVEIGGAKDSSEVYRALHKLDYLQIVNHHNFSFDIHTTQEERFAQDLFLLCVEQGWYILRLVAAEKSLEDIFMQLRKN